MTREIDPKLLNFLHKHWFIYKKTTEISDIYEKERRWILIQIFVWKEYITLQKFVYWKSVKYFRSDMWTFNDNFAILYSFIN